MDFQAVYHRSIDNYCYPLNKDELIINLKTGYDVEKVFLHYSDPFENGIMGNQEGFRGIREEIPFKKELKHQIWWTTTVKPQFKRCSYFFELQVKELSYFYFEDGIYSSEDLKGLNHGMQYFMFPWMNSADINITPAWVNDTIWYQIFPERFCNGDASINPPWVLPWAGPDEVVTNQAFYGGDLRGIINKLPYLKALNISGIYLTPINESPSSHKYDTINYFKIDPYFGDHEVMKELVNTAHELGIKVMLDGVFNHVGCYSQEWQDVIKKGVESRYYDWFMVNKWPFNLEGGNAHKGNYYSFAFNDDMPKLNTNNPEVIKYLLSICEYWVKEYEIDGIRLDVANEISHYFCKALRTFLKEIKPDLFILGEVWHDSISWLRGDEFDAVMNYPLSEAISTFWLEEDYTKKNFEHAINNCYTRYMQQTNDVLFNLLDSHDTIRLSTKIPNKDKVYQQLAVLFTMPGSPCIYYGTEVLLKGSHDPDNRRCMPWEKIEQGKYDEELSIIKELMRLRKEEPLFRSRNFHFTNMIDHSRVIEYMKIDDYDKERISIMLNGSKEDISVVTQGKIIFSHLYEENTLKANGILIRCLDKEVRESNNT